MSEAGLPQVLLLLSDPILENVYRKELDSPHYCAVWCEKGEGWKENLVRFSYDVIVVDLSLFQGNPVETLLTMRKLAPAAAVLALSDSQDARLVISAYQNGVANYFLKPVSPETIRWHVEKIIRKKTLSSTSATLNADLMVFSSAHQLHQCEDDEQMKQLGLKHLASVLGATSAEWLVAENEQIRSLGGTVDPATWSQGERVWIPLRDPKLGGMLFHSPSPDATALARAEFLVRNLEIALENYQRYVDIKQLTYIDDLTGLFNSRYLDMAVASAIESQPHFSVLFIDIDRFKLVNDNNGHLIGSQMLMELAALLKTRLRRPDLLFRYGGDEFIALMYGADGKKALEAAERLRAEVEAKRFFLQNREYKITLSIGVATFPEDGRDKKIILDMADQAMYSGKKQGRNKVFPASQLREKKAA